MRRYTVLLIPDLADGGYTATVPALPGCIMEGDTLDQALEHARDAIRLSSMTSKSPASRCPRRSCRWRSRQLRHDGPHAARVNRSRHLHP